LTGSGRPALCQSDRHDRGNEGTPKCPHKTCPSLLPANNFTTPPSPRTAFASAAQSPPPATATAPATATPWLVIRTTGTHLRITASRTSQLGTAQPGDTVDLAARLTGIHDVARDHYHAERAQLINLQHAAAPDALQRPALLEPEGARA
jgi:hypothetical protein